MPQHAFKLKTSTLAILSDDQRTMVTIPANASVTLVVGDIDEARPNPSIAYEPFDDEFIQLRCHDVFQVRKTAPWAC